jgi:hypothetical protein
MCFEIYLDVISPESAVINFLFHPDFKTPVVCGIIVTAMVNMIAISAVKCFINFDDFPVFGHLFPHVYK